MQGFGTSTKEAFSENALRIMKSALKRLILPINGNQLPAGLLMDVPNKPLPQGFNPALNQYPAPGSTTATIDWTQADSELLVLATGLSSPNPVQHTRYNFMYKLHTGRLNSDGTPCLNSDGTAEYMLVNPVFRFGTVETSNRGLNDGVDKTGKKPTKADQTPAWKINFLVKPTPESQGMKRLMEEFHYTALAMVMLIKNAGRADLCEMSCLATNENYDIRPCIFIPKIEGKASNEPVEICSIKLNKHNDRKNEFYNPLFANIPHREVTEKGFLGNPYVALNSIYQGAILAIQFHLNSCVVMSYKTAREAQATTDNHMRSQITQEQIDAYEKSRQALSEPEQTTGLPLQANAPNYGSSSSSGLVGAGVISAPAGFGDPLAAPPLVAPPLVAPPMGFPPAPQPEASLAASYYQS